MTKRCNFGPTIHRHWNNNYDNNNNTLYEYAFVVLIYSNQNDCISIKWNIYLPRLQWQLFQQLRLWLQSKGFSSYVNELKKEIIWVCLEVWMWVHQKYEIIRMVRKLYSVE